MLYERLKLAAALAILTAGVAAADSSVPFEIEVGNDQTVTVDPTEPLKLALFVEIANNSAVQSTIDGVTAMADAHNFEFDVFDAQLDIIRQINQMENALLRDYNGWIIASVEGNLVCETITKMAPENDILVVSVVEPTCGREVSEGQDLWSPGTLAHVGGNETPNAFKRIMLQALSDHSDQEVVKAGVLTGPDLHPTSVSFDTAQAWMEENHPEFQIVSKLKTDHSPPVSQQKAQTMLQANPDLDVLISVYSNMSKGAVPVLEAAGKLGQVRIYESGGTKWSVQALRDGAIHSTTGFYRETSAKTAVEALLAARAGEPTELVYLNDGHELLPEQKYGDVAIITRENLENYTPESP